MKTKLTLLLLCFCSSVFSETIILHYDDSIKSKDGLKVESMVFVRSSNSNNYFIHKNGPPIQIDKDNPLVPFKHYRVYQESLHEDETTGETNGFILLGLSIHYLIRIDLTGNFWRDVYLPTDKSNVVSNYGSITYIK